MSATRRATSPHAPPGLDPPPGNRRFDAFDALRALAALTIVAHHLAGPAGVGGAAGAVLARFSAGVAVFFAISGFLLYRPYVVARHGWAPQVPVGVFWLRRLLRIVPGYWLALTVIGLALGWAGAGHPWGLFYVFGQLYVPSQAFNAIPAAWSVCVEMSFYVCLPAYAWLVARTLRGSARAELALLGLLALASVAFHQLTAGRGEMAVSLMLPASFFLFAVGMGLALLSVTAAHTAGARFVARHGGACWLLAFALLVAMALGTSVGGSSAHPLYAPIALLIVLPAVFEGEGRFARVLRTRTLAWLGLISYGIYLWHQALIGWLVGRGLGGAPLVLATLALTVAVAAASYYAVERPALRRKPRGRRRPTRDRPTSTAAAPRSSAAAG